METSFRTNFLYLPPLLPNSSHPFISRFHASPLPFKSLALSNRTARRPNNFAVFMLLEPNSLEPNSELCASQEDTLPPSQAILLVDSANAPIKGADNKRMSKQVEQYTYLFAAMASSVGITSLAAGAVYYRFAWQMQGGEVPCTEMFGTFTLALGAAVGMEFWARWAHRALWHSSLWNMHESHHRPRDGPFELNDIFAIINAVPAIALMSYGFLHKGLIPGLCFGAGLGITVFGMAYMFVHDGLVHRRFPVGPIANVPYFQKVAAAHQLHHADKFHGVPYGLFLGPKELEEVGELDTGDGKKAGFGRPGLSFAMRGPHKLSNQADVWQADCTNCTTTSLSLKVKKQM